jgi:sortase A
VSVVYRVLGYLGRAMITIGTILLLFVAYQLWGTGLHTEAAQADLEDEYVDALTGTATTLPGGEEGSEASDAVAPEDVDDPVTLGDGMGIGEAYGLTPAEIAELPSPDLSESAGFISLPEIGSDWWYVEGVDLAWLRDGPGHFPGTPWPGQPGNASLAGHRTTYGAPFHRIDELQPGDEVLVETVQGEFRYELLSVGEMVSPDGGEMPIADASDPGSAHFIVNPDDDWILRDYGDNRITLVACHPKYSATQRIVVVGRLVGDVAPPTAPSIDEPIPGAPAADAEVTPDEHLLGSDEAALVPALLWGLAAAAVWLVAWLIGRRWSRAKWPAYLVGTPIFLLVLFGCFTQVERLLPAAY